MDKIVWDFTDRWPDDLLRREAEERGERAAALDALAQPATAIEAGKLSREAFGLSLLGVSAVMLAAAGIVLGLAFLYHVLKLGEVVP